MPECTEQFTFTIPIIRYTMEAEDRPTDGERQQLTKKMSLLTPVKIETPDCGRSGRRSSEPTKYYIPPQCSNRLSPRSARKRDTKRSKTVHKDDSPTKESFGPKPCNCENCRASSPLPPGYGPQTMSPGYDQMKMSLLEVPWSEDYTEASSDDLSSEWDSDVPEPAPPKVSEWMSPIEDQLGVAQRRFDADSMIGQMSQDEEATIKTTPEPNTSRQLSAVNLKIKLDQTMRTATVLAETLKIQIRDLIARENMLKEAITNGRLGVTTLTVSTINQVPRSYIIRDGRWILCNGMIQFPVASQASSTNLFNGLFAEPRCIGREVVTVQDPCVFNSIIKYEVIPSRRASEYTEDEYLCLKPTFNTTLERYMSVTKQIINDTCKNGVVRSLADNNLECGVRILSEYSFYPHKSSAAATLPLEYCIEQDGSCKLIVAWHVSNASIENFEFLKNENNFKKYFIKSGPYIEHVI